MAYRIIGCGDTVDFATLEEAQETLRACGGDFAETTLEVRGGTRIVDERGETLGHVVDDYHECLYCNREIAGPEGPVPAVEDDEAWGQMASAHEPGCDWIETRAHRLEVQ